MPYPLSCHVCPFVATLLQASGRLGTTPEGGQKTLPHCPCFFKDLKHMLHILSYYIYIMILEIGDTSEKMTQVFHWMADGHPVSQRRPKKHQLQVGTGHGDTRDTPPIFCNGYTAPVSVLWRCPLCSCGHTPSARCPLIRLYFYLPSTYLLCSINLVWFSDSICSFCLAVSPVKRDRHFKDHESRLMR